jgi:hypothetical protein
MQAQASTRTRRRRHYQDIDLVNRYNAQSSVVSSGLTSRRQRSGRHYVARMNAISRGVGAVPTLTHESITKAIGVQVNVPDAFNWNDPATRKYMTPVMDQGLCGGCWAFAVCSVLGTRTAIASNSLNPLLNPIYLMSATQPYSLTVGSGCDGGDVTATCQFLEQFGVVGHKATFLSSEQFRQANITQIADAATLNRSLPQVTLWDTFKPSDAAQTTCQPSANRHASSTHDTQDLYFARQGCTKQIYYDQWNAAQHAQDIIKTIQLEVFVRGPIISTFMVYPDFYDTDTWTTCTQTSTGASIQVYVHEWFVTEREHEQDGEHAVEITGWGRALDPNGNAMPFWICKNIWGTAWGDQGYFNIAMYPYNAEVGMDVPFVITDVDGSKTVCGGTTVVLPDCDYMARDFHAAATTTAQMEKAVTITGTSNANASASAKKPVWRSVVGGGILIAAIVWIVLWRSRLRKKGLSSSSSS